MSALVGSMAWNMVMEAAMLASAGRIAQEAIMSALAGGYGLEQGVCESVIRILVVILTVSWLSCFGFI